jgi:hypothetical protein
MRIRTTPKLLASSCGLQTRTLALKVDENGDPSSLFLTLGQLGKHQESAPASIESDTLKHHGQRIKVIFGDTLLFHDHDSTVPFVEAESPRKENTADKDPFGDVDGHSRLDFARPLIKGQ